MQLYINPPKSSWSLRVWALCRQLNIPIETKIVRYLADKDAQRQQFLVFSPTAKIPVLHHEGRTIWDSLAIVEYLAEDFPAIWPQDKTARAWARSACAEMHAGFALLREICDFKPLERIQLTEISPELKKELARLDQLWQEGLSRFGGPFLAGNDFTAADAFFLPVAGRIETYGLEAHFSPQSLAYQQTLLALPAYQAWLKLG
ncbi:glutathione S-transferase [Pasteurellaceae bacterium RH1A]|nr:glutathione S-transferase [Pasteurellaceae bacterium RH1A]